MITYIIEQQFISGEIGIKGGVMIKYLLQPDLDSNRHIRICFAHHKLPKIYVLKSRENNFFPTLTTIYI
ncbi:unnamed protein product [Rhizophagus irregularis]|nr:unnamed protein product [Rhizophagus irregularis]